MISLALICNLVFLLVVIEDVVDLLSGIGINHEILQFFADIIGSDDLGTGPFELLSGLDSSNVNNLVYELFFTGILFPHVEVKDDGLTLKPVHRFQMQSHLIPSGLLNLLELDFMFGLFDFTLLPQHHFLPFTIFDYSVPRRQIYHNLISIQSVWLFRVLIN